MKYVMNETYQATEMAVMPDCSVVRNIIGEEAGDQQHDSVKEQEQSDKTHSKRQGFVL